jgi:hypothetical protein
LGGSGGAASRGLRSGCGCSHLKPPVA